MWWKLIIQTSASCLPPTILEYCKDMTFPGPPIIIKIHPLTVSGKKKFRIEELYKLIDQIQDKYLFAWKNGNWPFFRTFKMSLLRLNKATQQNAKKA